MVKGIIKAALYCRIASNNPDDGYAISTQRDTLRSFAMQRGYGVHSEYADIGYPGNTLDRPAFTQMDADIKAGKINTVIVSRIDRIARTYELAVKWISDMEALGVKIIAVDGSHEHIGITAGALQDFMRNMRRSRNGKRRKTADCMELLTL